MAQHCDSCDLIDVTNMQCIGTFKVVHVQGLGVLLTLMLPPVPTLPRMTPCSLTLNWFPPETIPSGLFTCEKHPALSTLMKGTSRSSSCESQHAAQSTWDEFSARLVARQAVPGALWCYSSARVAQLPGTNRAMVRRIISKSSAMSGRFGGRSYHAQPN